MYSTLKLFENFPILLQFGDLNAVGHSFCVKNA